MSVAAAIGAITKRRAGRRSILPLVVSGVGFLASFALFIVIQHAVENVARLRFERHASDTKHVIEARIDSYGEILYGLAALFAGYDSVTRLQFHRYVESLDLKRRFPGFDVVNYAAYIRAEDKERFEESVRRDTSLDPRGYPNFAIKPPGERPEYFVLVYVEPMAGFEFAFGLDTGANPAVEDSQALAAAVGMTRDSGTLNSPGLPIRIKRQGREYIGLAMRLAVYRRGMPLDTVEQRRAAFVGSVGAGFNIENLMSGVLDEDKARFLRFRLYGAEALVKVPRAASETRRALLYDSHQSVETASARAVSDDPGSVFTRVLPMDVGGRIWELHVSAPKRSIIGQVDALLPWLVLAGGLLSSILLYGVLYSLASSRIRAVAIANEITGDLRESEASLAEAQRMAHLGNWTLDPATWSMTWSAETYRIFGLDPRSPAVAYADFMLRVHEDDRAALDAMIRLAVEKREAREMEHRIRLDDGSMRWAHTIAKPGYEEPDPASTGRRERVVGACLDITDRRAAAEALRTSAEQLQALSRRLVDIQELERRRFSRELHDVVGQNLTALSVNLDILKTQLPGAGSEGLRSRLDDSAALLESTTGAIENVMSELRPPMLDDYGLLPALQWYGTEFAKRTGIQVEVNGDERMERVPPAAEIALFRVAQEALNNVAKHAHATSVGISLVRHGGECVMSVSDNGRGIDSGSDSSPKRRCGLGMVTMRERMQAVGGYFEIGAAPGRGTKVLLRVPC